MARHGKIGGRLVADGIDDQAEKDDADGKRPEADAKNRPFVCLRETEVGLPVSDDVGPETEHEGGGDEGNETGPE